MTCRAGAWLQVWPRESSLVRTIIKTSSTIDLHIFNQRLAKRLENKKGIFDLHKI